MKIVKSKDKRFSMDVSRRELEVVAKCIDEVCTEFCDTESHPRLGAMPEEVKKTLRQIQALWVNREWSERAQIAFLAAASLTCGRYLMSQVSAW